MNRKKEKICCRTVLYYKRGSEGLDWWTYMASFAKGTWIAALVTMLACGLVNMIMTLTITTFSMPTKNAKFSEFSFSFLLMFNGTLCQGTPYDPDRICRRIVFVSLFLYGVVLFSAYSATLTSILATKVRHAPFNNLDEMLYNTDYKIVTVPNTGYVDRFKVRHASKRIHVLKSLCTDLFRGRVGEL